MDPQETQTPSPQSPPLARIIASPRILIGGSVFLLLLIGSILILATRQPPAPEAEQTETVEKPHRDDVVKIGSDTFSSKELEYYVKSMPAGVKKKDAEKVAIDRLIEDTIIIKGGLEDGLIRLSETEKEAIKTDMGKRYEYVGKVKEAIDGQNDRISGKIIAIWFLNERLGPLGYEGSKQLAFSKISNVHQRVKSGVLTIEQAAQLIRNDSQIAQLDNAYKANALIPFDTTRDKSITFSKSLDEQIWAMSEGQVSDVIAVKDRQPNPLKPIPDLDKHDETTEYVLTEALYVFVQVDNKTTGGKIKSYENWYSEKEREYGVEVYKNSL
jgi:hypothetical protein